MKYQRFGFGSSHSSLVTQVTVPTVWSVRSESKPLVDSSQCEIRIQTVGSVYYANVICHVERLIPVLLVQSLDFSFYPHSRPHSRGASALWCDRTSFSDVQSDHVVEQTQGLCSDSDTTAQEHLEFTGISVNVAEAANTAKLY